MRLLLGTDAMIHITLSPRNIEALANGKAFYKMERDGRMIIVQPANDVEKEEEIE